MKRQHKNILTKAIQWELRGETRHERLLHRLHCVVLVLSGHSASEIARIYGDSPRAVAYWVSSFNKDGLTGLTEEQRSGRPSKMNERQMKKLQTYLKRAKQKSESVNAKMLATFILSEFGISMASRQCWRILGKFKS